MEYQQDEKILNIKIENKNPVELLDLTEAFLSVADEYKRTAERLPDIRSPKEFKLYVKEIKTGSIETALVEYSPLVLPFMSNTVVVVEFSRYLKHCYDYFVGKIKSKPEHLEKKDYENISKIINPVAKDNGSQIIFNTIIQGNVQQTFNLASLEANAAQNAIARELQLLREPEHKLHEQVVMYWYQARDEASTFIGDKAIIESISQRPLKVIFASDDMKAGILHDSANPFRQLYVVDVTVETVQGEPVAYKIIHVHDRFEKPQQQS